MKTEIISLNAPQGVSTAVVALPDNANGADDKNAALPVVVLIHEWWGINDHMRDVAQRYAGEDFLCVAPDLFRGKTARDPQEAARLMQSLAIEDGIGTIKTAIDEVKHRYNTQKFGITGFCMGGTFALRAACDLGGDLAASIPFYGDVPEESVLAKLKVPTLFIAGTRDNWITPEKVASLEAAARKYNLPVEARSYEADHAFFNDTRTEVYDPLAARDAWRRALGFFRENLQK